MGRNTANKYIFKDGLTWSDLESAIETLWVLILFVPRMQNITSWAEDFKLGHSVHQGFFFVCASIEYSGESAHKRRFA